MDTYIHRELYIAVEQRAESAESTASLLEAEAKSLRRQCIALGLSNVALFVGASLLYVRYAA